MKATLEFNLDDHDDRTEHHFAINGRDAFRALSDVRETLRSMLKYGHELKVGYSITLSSGKEYEITEMDQELIDYVLVMCREIVNEATDDLDMSKLY